MDLMDKPGAVFVAVCFILMVLLFVLGGFVIPNI